MLPNNTNILGLAKQYEDVYLPHKRDAVKLAKDSLGMRLLMHIRDEAHRFAIAYHRKLRGKYLMGAKS